MAMAAAQLGALRPGEASQREPRELAAIGRATEWLNSPRLAGASLLGKVVLVQFGTYTCINWLRTLPYVRAWAQKYSRGATVIGVHTPEFGFEKNVDNVRRAIRQIQLEYPIVIDNEYAIWRAFRNQYWPALYLLDRNGRNRQHFFGEGEYEKSERGIQQLLKEAGVAGVGDGIVSAEGTGVELAPDWRNLRTPETYISFDRLQNFVSRGGPDLGDARVYAAPQRMTLNDWALAGEWTMGRQSTVGNRTGGRIVFRFHARDLHLVMGPGRPGGALRFRVSVDGQAPGPSHGLDVDEAGSGKVVEQRMYQLIRQPKPIVDRTFAIEFLDPGIEVFAFTFG